MEFRPLEDGMGQAVAERTILRFKETHNGTTKRTRETWKDVADRVALGNSLLEPRQDKREEERLKLQHHLRKATTLMSGRHLQHGDENQPDRNMEVFTNCATAPTAFLSFYLLLNGSGVGRSYDDALMVVDWDHAPSLRCVLDENHPDFDQSEHESVRTAKHKYGSGKEVKWFVVPDSREGWAKALEVWETAAWQGRHANKTLVLDFSGIRKKGTPIKGMQDRPASGPVPLMRAFAKAATLKGAGLDRWRQNLYIDHYMAECVLVGGARRSARMATKYWKDETIFDFIQVKRPIEYLEKTVPEILEYRRELTENKQSAPESFLYSANNSVVVDGEFWDLLNIKKGTPGYNDKITKHARQVFKKICECSYADGTGEPGIINGERLTKNDAGWDVASYRDGDYINSDCYDIPPETQLLLKKIAREAKSLPCHYITNPCGEIVLNCLGGFCVIADVVPFHADTLEEAEEAVRTVTRALIRTNLMQSVYEKEVRRTNRIGVGLTGVHEFAWKFFKLGFRDLIDEKKSKKFWLALSRFARAAVEEADDYSKELGVTPPHTVLTVKPAGTTSKLFGLTEGWHLPPHAEYLRWVQFSGSTDKEKVEMYKELNYPVEELKTYTDTWIVGFPTAPVITTLGMGENLVISKDATPEEQYRWLRLAEKYWLKATNENESPLIPDRGNQVSYTLKYDPEVVSFYEFRDMIKKNQPHIRCCSVMPVIKTASYEYQPEQPITKAEYEQLVRKLKGRTVEDVGKEHVDCKNGSCPSNFNTKKKEPLPLYEITGANEDEGEQQ
jgi:adenosylcobalamin-dependent ribonucleoside-triphosphate reductase